MVAGVRLCPDLCRGVPPWAPRVARKGAALRVFIIMTYFTGRYHDILYS
jgi:hypothetical protein